MAGARRPARDPAQQDGVVALDPCVGGRAGPARTTASGASASRPQERGEEPRVEGAGRGDEVAHHEAHRRTDVVAAREAPARVVEQRGPREERLDDQRDDVLGAEPPSIARS